MTGRADLAHHVTGRRLEHYNAGTMTRRTGNLELVPEELLELNPAATVPILLLPSTAELDVVRVEMALLLAVGGYAVARTEGAPRGRSLAYAAGVFVLAVAVALVKNRLGHH